MKRSEGSAWIAKSIILEFKAVPALPEGMREGGSIRAEVLIVMLVGGAAAGHKADTPIQEINLF